MTTIDSPFDPKKVKISSTTTHNIYYDTKHPYQMKKTELVQLVHYLTKKLAEDSTVGESSRAEND